MKNESTDYKKGRSHGLIIGVAVGSILAYLLAGYVAKISK